MYLVIKEEMVDILFLIWFKKKKKKEQLFVDKFCNAEYYMYFDDMFTEIKSCCHGMIFCQFFMNIAINMFCTVYFDDSKVYHEYCEK